MRNHIIVLLTLVFFITSCAKNTYTGTVKTWSHNKAEIAIPADKPIIIGEIDKKGNVVIKLEEELAENLKSIRLESNKSGNIKMKNKTVREAFYCKPETVIVNNGDENIEKVAFGSRFVVANINKEKLYGYLRLVSSKTFNESYFALGKKDFVKGFYIDFFYVEKDASVNGICKTKTYTMDMKSTVELIHEYDINLKKGWNIVKIEIVETYVDGEKRTPLKTVMTTVKELPENTQFILFN
ncbi:hypothetical protein [Marixanthomonas spongiae]|nr:hypothetical protein [Marixanthomonas spongiae]